MKPHSEKFLQQRKFFMVLPLLALPFIILLFWGLGGGKGVAAKSQEKNFSGLNIELPQAIFSEDDENWNKFDLYEQAKRDSLKFQQAKKNDPYFEVSHLTTSLDSDVRQKEKESNLNPSLGKKQKDIDPNEEMVNNKLEELYRELNLGSAHHYPVAENTIDQVLELDNSSPISSEVDRLEQMMLMMQESSQADPEMQQIEDVLEKILDIQYPERVKEKVKNQSLQNSKQVYSAEKSQKDDNISMLAQTYSTLDRVSNQQSQNGFYGLDDEVREVEVTENAFQAVVHDTQELTSGSSVKMRLINDMYVNDKRIPKNQFIYGVCRINGERLTIDIESIRANNSLLPVSLSVYDLDGQEGIYIPGNIARDVAKQSGNQAIQGIEFFSMDPSLSAQAANAGIEATKSLLSKEAKAIKVTVKAGYRVLLYNTNS